MVTHYDIKEISSIIKSDEFISNYNKNHLNNEKNKNIKLFLEKIKKNKNYYKLNINSLASNNKNIDINIIKSITNNINKITDKNKDIIIKNIQDKINNKETANIVINILIDCIIINSKFSNLYIELVKKIIENYKIDLNTLIDKFHNLLYKNYKDTEIKNYYKLLCEKNKCTDNSIGYSILVTKLEKSNIILNKVNKLIDELLDKMNSDYEEDLYKYILCIYEIIKLKNIKKEDKIYLKIKNKLDDISKNIKSKKIKFKIIDIFDEMSL
tara:strand:- start:3755 stop:4561 length:807 start_codon:yes stop_codon:yes gene_type:complete